MESPEEQMTAKAFRFPGIPDSIREYLLCILFHMLLPFLPLVIEAVLLSHVERKTLLLFFSVYPLSIGISSQSRLLFGITVAISVVYSTFFGVVSAAMSISNGAYTAGYLSVAVVMLTHSQERYNRHVADGKPFLEFA
jgi:hypothetical protein